MARDIAEIRRDIEDTRGRLRDTAEAIGWKAALPPRARDVFRETAAVVRERVASGEGGGSRGGNGGPSLGSRVGDIASAVTGGLGSAASSVGDSVGSAAHAVGETVGSATTAVGDAAGSVSDRVAAAGSAVADTAASAREGVSSRAGSAAGTAGAVGGGVREALPGRDEARQGVERVAGGMRANPLAIAAGALALGAIAGALLPSTRAEDERLGPLADEVRDKGAAAAQEAIEKGRDAVGDVGEQLTAAAREAGTGTNTSEA